jgi:hypothetical protein
MKYFKTHSEFLNEAKLSAVNEKYEVIFSDGIVQGKKFRSEKQALDFMKKEIASNKNLRDIAVYKPGMYSTTQTELVVKFWGDGSYLDNVSKRDKDLASKKLTEAKLSTVHRAAKKGSYPAVIVVVQDGKVIHQEPVSTPDVAPATFNVMQKKYPKALLHLEDKTGKRLFSESVVNERLARGLKPLLQIGTKITKKVGEDELMNLSDKFDRIDDEYAGDIASHLDMAIELMQDGEAGAATKMLKQFNKACKDVLNGKDVGSAFESTITEGKFNKKSLMRAMKKDDGMIQLGNGQEYIIYNPNNGNDDNADMWQDKVIFGLDQDGEEHEIKYSDIVRYDESRKINLKQDHLSSEEYQKAKKLKDFDKEDWTWNSKSGLYDRVNEATDLNDPVLVSYRATRKNLPKFKPAKAKSRRLSFDKYMDLLDARLDIDQQIKDLRDEMSQTLRDMEQEAEPEGGEIADEYGSTMMKQETEYAKLMAKKDKIMARIDKHRMA